MLRNLIFDFGKVLVDYDFSRFMGEYFDDDESRDEFLSIYASPEFLDVCDMEERPFRTLIDEQIALHPQYASQAEAFYERYTELVIGEVEGMRQVLTTLRSMGFRLYGLTNWCSKVHEVVAQYGIFRLLDGMVVSSDEHMIKPHADIYQRLLEKYDLKAEECLFADDKQVNVDGALQVGMDAVLFTDAAHYVADLSKRLGRPLFCDESMKWSVLSSRTIVERPWLNVRCDQVQLPDGKVYDEYYVLHYPTWINVIAITDDGRYIIERQYRHAIGEVSTEICAGCAEEGEDPLTAAKRELQEETGYAGGEWSEILVSAPNSSTMDNRCYSYLARGVKRVSSQHLDETEDIRVILCTREEVRQMLLQGEFKQAMMLAPLWKHFAQDDYSE